MSQEVGALITSAPGAGKTVVATEVIKGLGVDNVLIVAPLGTHVGAWKRTLVRQGVFEPDEVKILIGNKKGKAAFADLMWGKRGAYITTPQWFALQGKSWEKIKPQMVVFDEVHMAGTYDTATRRALHMLGDVPYRMGLSGTPLRNKFENAWAIVKWIEPRLIALDFWAWRVVACETVYDPFSYQNRRVVGEKVPGTLFNQMSCYIQHRQRERCCDFHPNGFLAHLPAPLELDRLSKMTTAQNRFYQEIEQSLASSLIDDSGEELKVNAEIAIVARSMLRSCALGLPSAEELEDGRIRLFFEPDAPSPKLDQLIDDLPDYEGRHTLVLTHSKQFARIAAERIADAGFETRAWHGDVTKKRRDEALEGFTSGEIEVIVGVISAMGTGTDGLQEVCWNVSWLSLDDDPTNNIQGIGRLDRLGQDRQVVRRNYLSERSIDVGFYSKQMEAVLKLEQSLKKARTP